MRRPTRRQRDKRRFNCSYPFACREKRGSPVASTLNVIEHFAVPRLADGGRGAPCARADAAESFGRSELARAIRLPVRR